MVLLYLQVKSKCMAKLSQPPGLLPSQLARLICLSLLLCPGVLRRPNYLCSLLHQVMSYLFVLPVILSSGMSSFLFFTFRLLFNPQTCFMCCCLQASGWGPFFRTLDSSTPSLLHITDGVPAQKGHCLIYFRIHTQYSPRHRVGIQEIFVKLNRTEDGEKRGIINPTLLLETEEGLLGRVKGMTEITQGS